MSTGDYVVDVLLILVILRHVRPRVLSARSTVLPLVLIAWAGTRYLHGFTVGGNDVLLIVLLVVVGLGLGTWSGAATSVWISGETVLARAGAVAVATWIAGMGFRFAFAVYANTASGGRAVERFSRHHAITSAQAWTTALVLMAFAEVLARVGLLQWRRTRIAFQGAG